MYNLGVTVRVDLIKTVEVIEIDKKGVVITLETGPSKREHASNQLYFPNLGCCALNQKLISSDQTHTIKKL